MNMPDQKQPRDQEQPGHHVALPGIGTSSSDQLLHSNEYYPVQPVQPSFAYWSHDQSNHGYYPNSFQYPAWDESMSHSTTPQPLSENGLGLNLNHSTIPQQNHDHELGKYETRADDVYVKKEKYDLQREENYVKVEFPATEFE